MKFLGLTGALLWLGTLLGLAGGAERTRVDFALLEKDVAAASVSAWGNPTKCDADKKLLADELPVSGSEAISDVLPHACAGLRLVAHPARGACSASVEDWHLGQGPPRV